MYEYILDMFIVHHKLELKQIYADDITLHTWEWESPLRSSSGASTFSTVDVGKTILLNKFSNFPQFVNDLFVTVEEWNDVRKEHTASAYKQEATHYSEPRLIIHLKNLDLIEYNIYL